jgi:DNA invertase Pin-like site-specific DNA recombinase
MSTKITAEHLAKKAIVYVRQSTPHQLVENTESRRRQYALKERAEEFGFRQVEIIDQDLGRSGSGQVARPGFQRLVSEVCSGLVGAVLAIEASRLARNGRDWHHLVDLCAVVGALLIDHDGVYDPRVINDRLLLGLKGTMSEFELSLFRQRSYEAIKAKAKRGELRFCLPIGYYWTRDNKIEIDPDKRIQEAIHLVFRKFDEMASARQVLLWFRQEKVSLPAVIFDKLGDRIQWKLPIYNTILGIISNPIYSGAYAFGKTGNRTYVSEGKTRKTRGHLKPQDKWEVLIHKHHEGYISWEKYKTNQKILAENAHMKQRTGRKNPRGGRALLTGLIRCRRCGRMLHVAYAGLKGATPRYHCRGAHINHGEKWCISFGGLRVDQAISHEILNVIESKAIEAAIAATNHADNKRKQQREALVLELEQRRYEAKLAARRYEAVDPDNRLVASELESRWNASLRQAQEMEQRLRLFDDRWEPATIVDKNALISLATDLPSIWNDDRTDIRTKHRIVRILIEEIIADVDNEADDIILVIHWTGGRHSELRIRKNKTGRHSRCTGEAAVDVVRRMSGKWPDDQIAGTLNRLGYRTGAGNPWNEMRVKSLRNYLKLPSYDPKSRDTTELTLEEAASRLGISSSSVRRLICDGIITATQVVQCAPWQIPLKSLNSDKVNSAVEQIKTREKIYRPRRGRDDNKSLMIPGI